MFCEYDVFHSNLENDLRSKSPVINLILIWQHETYYGAFVTIITCLFGYPFAEFGMLLFEFY